jgi:hypothetical protein
MNSFGPQATYCAQARSWVASGTAASYWPLSQRTQGSQLRAFVVVLKVPFGQGAQRWLVTRE